MHLNGSKNVKPLTSVLWVIFCIGFLALASTRCISKTFGYETDQWLVPGLPKNLVFEQKLQNLVGQLNRLHPPPMAQIQLSKRGHGFDLAGALMARVISGSPPRYVLLESAEAKSLKIRLRVKDQWKRSVPFLESRLICLEKKSSTARQLEQQNVRWADWISKRRLAIPMLGERFFFLLSNLIPHSAFERLEGGVRANRSNLNSFEALHRFVQSKNLILSLDHELLLSRWINGEFDAIWIFSEDLSELKTRTPFEFQDCLTGKKSVKLLTPTYPQPTNQSWTADLVEIRSSPGVATRIAPSINNDLNSLVAYWETLNAFQKNIFFKDTGFFPAQKQPDTNSRWLIDSDPEWHVIQAVWAKAFASFFMPEKSPDVPLFLRTIDRELNRLSSP